MNQNMRMIFILLVVFLVLGICWIHTSFIRLDLMNKSDIEASHILYNYILKENSMTFSELEKFANINMSVIKAHKVDLNDDGVMEIVGVVYSPIYLGTEGYDLFILQKKEDSYEQISNFVNFEPLAPVYILPFKTEGYRNILFRGSVHNNFSFLITKYINGAYENGKQLKNMLDICR